MQRSRLAKEVDKNTIRSMDNALGWKIATVIAILTLTYTILYNNHQDTSMSQCEERLYEKITNRKMPRDLFVEVLADK